MLKTKFFLILNLFFVSTFAHAQDICAGVLLTEAQYAAQFERDYGVTYLPHSVLDSNLPTLVLNRIREASEASDVSFKRYLGRNHFKDVNEAQATAAQLLASTDFQILKDGYMNARVTPNLLRAAFATRVESDDRPDVSIRFVHEINGHGVFAERRFKKGEYIGEYAGVTKVVDNQVDLENMYLLETGFTYAKRPVSTDGASSGNFGRFLNHSPLPIGAKNGVNATFANFVYQGRPVTVVFAVADIQPGSQIFIDYGDAYWKGLGIVPTAF